MTAVKERLEAVKAGQRGMQQGQFNFAQSRIAKPLRGGGGADATNGNVPVVLSGTQGSSAAQESAASKRASMGGMSWFSR